jgi:hypothetical protein
MGTHIFKLFSETGPEKAGREHEKAMGKERTKADVIALLADDKKSRRAAREAEMTRMETGRQRTLDRDQQGAMALLAALASMQGGGEQYAGLMGQMDQQQMMSDMRRQADQQAVQADMERLAAMAQQTGGLGALGFK